MNKFDKRVKKNFLIASILAISGFVLIWISAGFIFNLCCSPFIEDLVGARIIKTFFYIIVCFSYIGGWIFRSLYIINIDTCISSMGELQKKMLIAALQEDLKIGEKNEKN